MKIKRGFTLIELLIFIIALGIMASVLALSYGTLFKSSRIMNQQQAAINAAMRCMEWYLGQKTTKGFDAIATNAITPSFCTANHDYEIASKVDQRTIGGDNNFKLITISVKNAGNATLSTIIADY